MTSVADFLQQLGSSAPTPGGGSAAIVTSQIGIALVLMATRVSAPKHDDPKRLDQFVNQLETMSADLESCYAQDIDAFNALMACYSLPKSTDQEKATRRERLVAATMGAADVPFASAEKIKDALDASLGVEEYISNNIYSDHQAGVMIMLASFDAILLNVEINLKPGYMIDQKANYTDKLIALRAKVSILKDALAARVSQRS